MDRIYDVGGVACRVQYHPDDDETFFHPARSDGRWVAGEFEHLAKIVEQHGYRLTGGHEYYLPVAGNVFTGAQEVAR